MTRFLTLTAIFCVAFSAAVASDVHMWGPTAFVHMQPTTIPGIAVPESVTVPEDGAGQIVIYEGGLS